MKRHQALSSALSQLALMPPSSGTGQLRLQGDSAYTATLQVSNHSGAGPQQAVLNSTGRWLSATCPAQPWT